MTSWVGRRGWFGAVAAVALAFVGCECSDRTAATSAGKLGTVSSTASLPREVRGNMDVTFLVTADTHFGVGVDDKDPRSHRPVEDAQGIEKAQLQAIRAMNGMAGRSFPAKVGLDVGKPRGVLVAGDLTDTSHPAEWARFVAYYGTDGTDGVIEYPVYETWGNHDKHHGWYVRKRVEERHGSIRYTIDWDDLHVMCLGEAPDDEDLAWLAGHLRSVGTEIGVVVYMHYPLKGPFAENNWFGNGDYRRRLGDILSGYRVLGVFHGHYHASQRYRWRGIDVYNVGSPKHGYHSFAAVRVTDDRMVVASWDYRSERWKWVHDKELGGETAGR